MGLRTTDSDGPTRPLIVTCCRGSSISTTPTGGNGRHAVGYRHCRSATGPATAPRWPRPRRIGDRPMWRRLLDALPRGYTLDEHEWQRRHRLLLWVLGIHVPGIAVLGLLLGKPTVTVATVLAVPTAAVGLGYLLRAYRRTASIIVTFGLVYCSAALVAFTDGRDRGALPLLHHHRVHRALPGLGAVPPEHRVHRDQPRDRVGVATRPDLQPHRRTGQPVAVVVDPRRRGALRLHRDDVVLAGHRGGRRRRTGWPASSRDIEIGRRQFTSDLLANLARRNQSLLYRQLDIINQLEDQGARPGRAGRPVRLDHLATRVRRNAENLLVLSGEQAPRTWSEPVPLRDVLRAAIAETEDLDAGGVRRRRAASRSSGTPSPT